MIIHKIHLVQFCLIFLLLKMSILWFIVIFPFHLHMCSWAPCIYVWFCLCVCICRAFFLDMFRCQNTTSEVHQIYFHFFCFLYFMRVVIILNTKLTNLWSLAGQGVQEPIFLPKTEILVPCMISIWLLKSKLRLSRLHISHITDWTSSPALWKTFL